MSDYIPADIQLEIMTRLPLKSLIQFRSVSKTWKSIIDSSAFISKHYNNGHHTQTQVQHLLVMYQDTRSGFIGLVEDKYVSIVDDHTFPKQIVSLTPPPLVKKLQCPRLIGTSRGLVGLYSQHYRDSTSTTDVVVIWNVSIRKAVAVFVPNVAQELCRSTTTLGFGVCRVTNDPKIVKIKQFANCNPIEVEVFTLSTGAWRRYRLLLVVRGTCLKHIQPLKEHGNYGDLVNQFFLKPGSTMGNLHIVFANCVPFKLQVSGEDQIDCWKIVRAQHFAKVAIASGAFNLSVDYASPMDGYEHGKLVI
ncbi:F-box protein At4g22390-like [Bidens hawaiensis]|uniref:F-box protein At4g22390-like n=1 Tax=Bidens hawaiensis TaxID=980011 RepID=UPI00404B1BBD